MRPIALIFAAGCAVLAAAPAVAEEDVVRIDSRNMLNVAYIEQSSAVNRTYLTQTGMRNIARIRQRGQVNAVDVSQTGVDNRLGVAQYGGTNSASIRQYDSVASVAFDAANRVNRGLVVQGGETSYVTTYQNGGVNIAVISLQPQVYGVLGRR